MSLAVIGGFNAAGCYLLGWLGDKFPKHILLGTVYILRSLLIVVYFSLPATAATTLVFAAMMGVLWLGVAPLVNGLVVQMFGLSFVATLSGIAFVSHQAGSFLRRLGRRSPVRLAGQLRPRLADRRGDRHCRRDRPDVHGRHAHQADGGRPGVSPGRLGPGSGLAPSARRASNAGTAAEPPRSGSAHSTGGPGLWNGPNENGFDWCEIVDIDTFVGRLLQPDTRPAKWSGDDIRRAMGYFNEENRRHSDQRRGVTLVNNDIAGSAGASPGISLSFQPILAGRDPGLPPPQLHRDLLLDRGRGLHGHRR